MDAPISSPTHTASTSATSQLSLPAQQQPQPQPQPQRPQQPAADPKMAAAQGSADAFLRDFTLVAEAAKRAQVAVMVRDFENCGLS